MNQTLRRQFLALRRLRAANRAQRALSSDAICQRIAMLPQFIEAKTIGIYLALADEVNLQYLIKNHNKQWFAPRIEGGNILFAAYNLNELIPNRWHILEPSGAAYRHKLDLIIVPLVAFDKNCQRIGMGAGFYDRFLASEPPKATIGAAFSYQQVSQGIVSAPWDVPLDMIVTETEQFKLPCA